MWLEHVHEEVNWIGADLPFVWLQEQYVIPRLLPEALLIQSYTSSHKRVPLPMSGQTDSSITKFILENPLTRDNLPLYFTKWITSNVIFSKLLIRRNAKESTPPCLLFYSVSFHFIYFVYVGSILKTAGCISQSNKQEGQITYHSHSNSK